MTRRKLLLAGAAAPALAGLGSPRVPTSEGELNRFAASYNAYVMRLREGRVDLDQWRRVVRAWRQITGDKQ